LRAIQRHWPETKITWVCATVEQQLLSVLDGVRFAVIDKNEGWRGYRDLRRQLAGEKFDILIQMQTSARANLAGACVKADIKLGWDKARARDFHSLFMTHSIPATKQEHQVQGHLSFARTLGLDADEPVWDFPIREENAAIANEMLPAEQRTLTISPCSRHRYRNWLADRYAAVADYAIDSLGMRVALMGGPSEHEASMGEAIEQSMANEAINLIGKDTLPQSLALLQRADVVLSPDSGPVHLANALGTPVIGLYACTWSKRSGPYNSLDLCVDKFSDAARQFLRKNPEDLRWGTRIEQPRVMDLIRTDEVIERLNLAVKRLEH
jgi:heptosyltransferase I